MFSKGKAKPERMKAGIMKKKVEIWACCCVEEIVEMKRPTPTELIKKKILPKRRRRGFPRRGTSNQKTPMRAIMIASARPIIANGRVFPSISSQDRMGVTMICSRVPISLSLTMA